MDYNIIRAIGMPVRLENSTDGEKVQELEKYVSFLENMLEAAINLGVMQASYAYLPNDCKKLYSDFIQEYEPLYLFSALSTQQATENQETFNRFLKRYLDYKVYSHMPKQDKEEYLDQDPFSNNDAYTLGTVVYVNNGFRDMCCGYWDGHIYCDIAGNKINGNVVSFNPDMEDLV